MGGEPDNGPRDADLAAAEAEAQALASTVADLLALAGEAADAPEEAARLRAEALRRLPGLTVARARVLVLRARRTMRRLRGG